MARKALMCVPIVAVAIGFGAGAAQAVPKGSDRTGETCENQSGAPGYLVWSSTSNQWVCKITGDAPQQKKKTPPPPASPFGS